MFYYRVYTLKNMIWVITLFFFFSPFVAHAGASSQTVATNSQATDVPAEPMRLAVGVNDLGGQLRFHFTPRWAVEGRFLTGSASSGDGNIKATVLGLRGYRFYQEHHRCRFYLGLEADHAATKLSSSKANNASGFGNTQGVDAGGFAGLEYRLPKRVSIDLDMGPYLINLSDKNSNVSDSAWDFVVNIAVNFYIF
jgi:hypothetical protein